MLPLQWAVRILHNEEVAKQGDAAWCISCQTKQHEGNTESYWGIRSISLSGGAVATALKMCNQNTDTMIK